MLKILIYKLYADFTLSYIWGERSQNVTKSNTCINNT
ncbi:hypothetical protein [Escherichia phage PH1062]|nr:hypothetical protein [Escherichia phage PH1062]